MLTEDYLIRRINLAIAALLRILGLKKEGSFDEALLLVDITLEQLLGLRASMIKSLDDEKLYYLLTNGGEMDTLRLAIVADLFTQEADVYAAQNRAAESVDDYIRALRYMLEVLFTEGLPGTEERIEKVEYLVQKLDLNLVPANTLWPLSGYYEETGAYAKAEAILNILAARPETRTEILPELIAFYERLLEKPAQDIEAGGVRQDQARNRLSSWRNAA